MKHDVDIADNLGAGQAVEWQYTVETLHVSLYLYIHFICMKLCICMQICCVNCQFYLPVLVTTFVFYFSVS